MYTLVHRLYGTSCLRQWVLIYLLTKDDIHDNTELTNLFAADPSVFLLGVALAFDLHVSWLAEEVVSELCWYMGVLDLKISPSTAHSFAVAGESLRLLADGFVCLHEVSQLNHNESSEAQLPFTLSGSEYLPCLERRHFSISHSIAIIEGRRKQR